MAACLVAGALAAPAHAEPVEIDIQDYFFQPASVTVAVGTTIRWTNKGADQHTVTSDTGAFGSLLLAQNGTFEHTFTAPGDYGYHCTPHPFMTGTIHVVDPGPVAVADATPTTALVGEEITFDGSGSFSTSEAAIVKWEWDFRDGQTGSGETVTHAFAAAGTYDVVLTVTDADGLTDSDVVRVQVSVADAPPPPPPPPPPAGGGTVPSLAISNAKVKEGDRGTKAMTFLVRLSEPSAQPVSVQFKTRKGTAKPRSDFLARAGTLTFAPGRTVLKPVVKVKGDRRKEKTEKFSVLLANAIGATIADGLGIGTIRDND